MRDARVVTRTSRYKYIYFAALIAGLVMIGGAIIVFGLWTAQTRFWLAVLVLLLLLPGRVQRYFWSDFHAGLRYLEKKDYVASKASTERFLVRLEAQPWIRRLVWLGYSVYSRDVEVLARNNLGAAMIAIGEIEGAKEQLTRAVALDRECPLPYSNMGVLCLHSATLAEALVWFETAGVLGARESVSDRGEASAHDVPDIIIGGPFVIEILDNDKTPFKFVVACLEEAFGMSPIHAIRIARAVDQEGSAPCAGFETKKAAQAKAGELRSLANRSATPFACQVRRT